MGVKRIYSNKYLQPILHVLFWGVLIFSSYFFRRDDQWKGFDAWQYKMMVLKMLLAFVFYFNTYFLYPAIFKKRGILLYLTSVVATLTAMFFLRGYIEESIDKIFPEFNRDWGRGMRRGSRMFPEIDAVTMFFFWLARIWGRLQLFFLVMGTSFTYRIIMDNARAEKIRKERENENLKTELSFLRSQVSPHFIFNILNNMVSLARKKSDLLEPSLIQLSNLIRYMLYENDDEKVTLQKEIDYLKSYINLQLLRFGDDVTITFNPPENTGHYTIEPMLLAPFVENAFKHGVGMVENPQINIMLVMDDETGWLDFKVMNSIAPPRDSKDKSSGIGLVNVRRRLELLYKEDFSLDIMQTDSVFVTDLKLKLK